VSDCRWYVDHPQGKWTKVQLTTPISGAQQTSAHRSARPPALAIGLPVALLGGLSSIPRLVVILQQVPNFFLLKRFFTLIDADSA
jgi:hypothetical protein